jgi:F like protein
VPDLSAIFRRPFDQQVAAYRLRLGDLVPTSRWDDLRGLQHDRAFMVAGATKADLLADLAGAVDKAIARGTTLDEFRRDFREIVTRQGWHGWTGEGTDAGEAWRTRVIYKTNVATSYAAGRRAQLIEGNFKYWVYRHGGSLEPREHHLAWDGIALPPDHPFWVTHAPPNGWGCSCRIFGARTRAGIRRVGGDPDKTLPDDWQAVDPRTNTPTGIDRGWDHAPGSTVADVVTALAPKLEALPDRPSVALIQDWLKSSVFADWLKRPEGTWPLVRISAEDAARLGTMQRVAGLSADSARKQLARHPEITPAEYLAAQRVVDRAQYRIADGPRKLTYVLEDDGPAGGYIMVVKAVIEADELFVVSYYRLSREAAKKDRELRRLLGRG